MKKCNNHSTDYNYIKSKVNQNKNQIQSIKQNSYKKNIIENKKNKNFCLSKYINKDIHGTKNINNIKTKNFNQLKELYENKNNPELTNDDIFAISNTYINFSNNNSPEKNTKKTIENNSSDITHIRAKNTFDKKVTNYYYCFPDHKFRKIKGLSKDKFLKYFRKHKNYHNKSVLKFINLKCHESSYNNYEVASNIKNYYSNLKKDNDENINLFSETKKIFFDTSGKEKNNEDYSLIKTFSQKWVSLPFKLEKYVKRIVIIKYGYLLFGYLNIINKEKIIYLKEKKIFGLIKNIDKKIIKYYFRKYRDKVLIEKVKSIYKNNYVHQNNNKHNKLRARNPKKNNKLENKAKLFVTKTKNDNKCNNIKIIYLTKNVEIFFEKIKTIIYKFTINNYYIFLKKFLSEKNDKTNEYDKLGYNKVSDKKVINTKKHIKIRYIRKGSDPNLPRNNLDLSNKTTSSDMSRSTIHSSKKMNIQRRIIYTNYTNQQNKDKKEKSFEFKLSNIIFEYFIKKRKIYFSRWKKIVFYNNNNKEKKYLNKRNKFLNYFLTHFFYYNENNKPKLNNKILLGSAMYIWIIKAFSLK